MPPLHEALVEVHREYEKASRTARDMAEMYKKETAAADVLNAQSRRRQEENQQLKNQLRRAQVVLGKSKRTDVTIGITKPTFRVGVGTTTEVGTSRKSTK